MRSDLMVRVECVGDGIFWMKCWVSRCPTQPTHCYLSEMVTSGATTDDG